MKKILLGSVAALAVAFGAGTVSAANVPPWILTKQKSVIARLEVTKKANWRDYENQTALLRTIQAKLDMQQWVLDESMRCISESSAGLRNPTPVAECIQAQDILLAAVQAWDENSPPVR